jgi:hypothetical protein
MTKPDLTLKEDSELKSLIEGLTDFQYVIVLATTDMFAN